MRDAVVIIGGGMMGSGIAAVSALYDGRTIIVDVTEEKAEEGYKKAVRCMRELEENDLTGKNETDRALSRLEVCADMEEALRSANLVIEAIVENLEMKQEIFEEIDRFLPADIPVLSNTSGLRITDIAERMVHPERAVTSHFWFPAHLVPLVEVVIGDKTSEAVAVSVKERIASWKKAPVLVKKDFPGQLANRILQAVIREASNIVEMGLAEPEDVDTAVKMGMGIRFPVWGPLEHVDAVGMDLCVSVQDTVLPGISSAPKANGLMRSMYERGELGSKTGRGFYDWSERSMKELEERRNDFIIYALKKIRN